MTVHAKHSSSHARDGASCRAGVAPLPFDIGPHQLTQESSRTGVYVKNEVMEYRFNSAAGRAAVDKRSPLVRRVYCT